MCLVAEKRQRRKRPVDILPNLIETCVMKAIKLCPEVVFWNADDIEFLQPEISLRRCQQRLKVKHKGLAGFTRLEEISVHLGNLASITSHLSLYYICFFTIEFKFKFKLLTLICLSNNKKTFSMQ